MATQSKPKPINLTQTTYFLRNMIKFGAIFLVLLMVGRVFLTSFTAYWKATHPEPPPPPTMGFGYLPAIQFPQSQPKPKEYRLETVDGDTPFISDRAGVFNITTSQPSLLTVERARQKASGMGYVFEPEVIDSRTYRWTFTNPILSTLTMDILNGTFEIKTNWPSYPDLLVKDQHINTESAITKVKSTLQQAGVLYSDLASGIVTTQYVKAIGGEFIEAESLSEADFVQVDIHRKLIDEKYSSVTSKPDVGPVHAIVAKNGILLEMQMSALPVQYTPVETYPLRSTQEAWQQVLKGEAYIAHPGNTATAVVREVALAYFEPTSGAHYYQPVYMFKGDGGFTAYVPALVSYVYQSPPPTGTQQ